MSREVFQIANSMGIENLHIQLALQIAPLLAGVKISNLLIVERRYADAVIKMFQNTEISFFLILQTEEKVIFLLYRRERLCVYLQQEEVKKFLSAVGYHTAELNEILRNVSEKYKRYAKNQAAFPHELGLLLGYPAEDVYGFIENQGKNFLYTGYWKVYYNLSIKLKMFECYQQAETAVMRMIRNGNSIPDIINFYQKLS